MIGFVMHAGFEAGLRRNEIVETRPSWFSILWSFSPSAKERNLSPQRSRSASGSANRCIHRLS